MIEITKTLDCMGEKCPYPVLRSKKKPLSAERIPERMESLGHEIISLEEIGKSKWEILIKINKNKKNI